MSNQKREILAILVDIGALEEKKFCQYLFESVSIVYEDPEAIHNTMEKVYHEISIRHNTPVIMIEKTFKKGFEKVWEIADPKKLEKYFGHVIAKQKEIPHNVELIATIADYLHLKDQQQEHQRVLAILMHDIGIHSDLKGYRCIREAIDIVYDNPETIHRIMTEIYPKVAQKYGTTLVGVEKCIRQAITRVWARTDTRDLAKYCDGVFAETKSKPTNGRFIREIATYLRNNIS